MRTLIRRIIERLEQRRIVRAIRREDRIERRLYGGHDMYSWLGKPQQDNDKEN